MENKAHALLAGLFTVSLLAAAIVLALWFRRDRTEQIPYEIATKLSIPGLTPQAAVRYRGLEVGKVNSIVFDSQVTGQILVRFSVKPDTPITQSTFSTLGYQGVTGIAYVQLDDDGKNPARLPSSPQQVARIEMRPSLFDALQNKGLAILTQTEELVRGINNTLNPANQKVVVSTLENINRVASEVEAIPRQLQPTLAKLPAAIDQTNKTLSSIATLANNTNALATAMQAPNGALDKLSTTIDQVGSIANKIELQALPLANDARSTMRAFNRTLESLREQPQSLLFGTHGVEPGPGEAGFAPSAP